MAIATMELSTTMDEKFTVTQTIGNWISTLLLGSTKELIVRIDERVAVLSQKTDRMEERMGRLEREVMSQGADIRVLKEDFHYLKEDVRYLKSRATA